MYFINSLWESILLKQLAAAFCMAKAIQKDLNFQNLKYIISLRISSIILVL